MIHEAWQSFLQRDGASAPVGAATDATRGIAWLPELTVASFEGADVSRFLQGYLTCDTTTLDAGRLVPAAICSLKGRVVVNGWCSAPQPEQILFVIHDSLFEALAGLLRVYLRFSRTRLVNRRADLLVFGGLGLDAAAGGLAIDDATRLFLCSGIEPAKQLWRTQPHLPTGAWQAALIEAGWPLVSTTTSDAFLPQMLNLPALGAISFDKGCYLGQEVVARAQHRGQVKRHLVHLLWRGATVPDAGSELTDGGGRTRGTVIQSIGAADHGRALAVIQDDTAYPLYLDATTFDPAA